MLRIRSPFSRRLLAELACDTKESVANKFAAARTKGLEAMRPSSFDLVARRQSALKFGQLLRARVDELSKVIVDETGKPIAQARGEVLDSAGRMEWYADNAERALGDEHVTTDELGYYKLAREPVGVVASISAWNFPVFTGVNVLIPALLAGNAVLYKPSEFSSLTGTYIVDLLHNAGFPQAAIQLVCGGGDVGRLLCEQPLDMVSFTGSLRTGQEISRHFGGTLTRLQLELGGNDAAYVHSDMAAAVARAADSLAYGALENSGQSCASIERIYAHEAVADAFLAELVRAFRTYRVGDPAEEATAIGPLTQSTQLGILSEHVRDAEAKGAHVLLGGRLHDVEGFFQPTIIAEASDDMAVMQEESFGPLVVVQRVASADEALQHMNASQFGLTGAVYAMDEAVAETMLRGMQVGTAYWNTCARVESVLPWCARKNSGCGATMGIEGLRNFTCTKSVMCERWTS